MTVSSINSTLFTALSALNGRTLSTLSAVNGLTLVAGGGGPPSTNLRLEHRADDLTAGNNNAIATWVSHAPTSNNLSQGTAGNRPTQRDNTLNSLPTAQFDGNDVMDLASTVAAGSNVNFTYFAVMKCTDAGTRTLICGDGGGPQVRMDGSKIQLLKSTVADMGHSATTLSTSTFYTIAVSYDGSTVRFYVNGSADGTSSASQTFANPVSALGSRSGNEFFLGNVAHQLFYDAVLNSTDRTAAFDYLRGIWATW